MLAIVSLGLAVKLTQEMYYLSSYTLNWCTYTLWQVQSLMTYTRLPT